MRFEPPIDRDALRTAIETAYGLPRLELRFLPDGFAACYDVRAADGVRYFLKVWPSLRQGEPLAEEQRATLEFARALHEGGFGIRVTYPLLTRAGSVWGDLDGTPFALFPFLEGQARGRWTEAQRHALGTAVAALHLATPALQHFVPRRETFAIPYELALRRHVEVAAGLPTTARPGALAARDWVVASRAEIEAQLARLHDLQARARALTCAHVVCHMDLHGGNVLSDDRGDLHVLDWDDVRLAPPEHDLWFGLDGPAPEVAHLAPLIQGYRAGGAQWPLHVDHLAFYLLRRDLDDTSIALARLLDDGVDRRDDEQWAQGLRDWGTARWARFDRIMAGVADVVATDARGS